MIVDPNEILRHQVRIVPALAYLATFRHVGQIRVVPEPPLPITDDEVTTWIAANEFTRATLAPHVARALAYIDRFKSREAA